MQGHLPSSRRRLLAKRISALVSPQNIELTMRCIQQLRDDMLAILLALRSTTATQAWRCHADCWSSDSRRSRRDTSFRCWCRLKTAGHGCRGRSLAWPSPGSRRRSRGIRCHAEEMYPLSSSIKRASNRFRVAQSSYEDSEARFER